MQNASISNLSRRVHESAAFCSRCLPDGAPGNAVPPYSAHSDTSQAQTRAVRFNSTTRCSHSQGLQCLPALKLVLQVDMEAVCSPGGASHGAVAAMARPAVFIC